MVDKISNTPMPIILSAEDFVLPDEFSDEDDLPVGSLSKEEDSDFVMDDGDESGSDWEASQRSKGKVV